MPRILMRKFALTSTDKFLDIGIVGSVSHVQIAISDNRGNRMFIPHATWKMFKRRADIERLMQYTVLSSSPIQYLNVTLVKI